MMTDNYLLKQRLSKTASNNATTTMIEERTATKKMGYEHLYVRAWREKGVLRPVRSYSHSKWHRLAS